MLWADPVATRQIPTDYLYDGSGPPGRAARTGRFERFHALCSSSCSSSIVAVLALIGVVLLQRSEGGGLGMGATGGFMTSRGTAALLSRATEILAGLFFVTRLCLSIIAGLNRKPNSILQGGQSAPVAPAGPTAPLNPKGF